MQEIDSIRVQVTWWHTITPLEIQGLLETMPTPTATFHGPHLKVLNHMTSKEEIQERSNMITLHFVQECQDNPTKIQIFSKQKEPQKQFRSLLW